jgi:histidinol-phosphatase (PHP family)
MLPPDSHVHSQWSWDAVAGSMEETCRHAAELGLPSVAFTEHADLTPWVVSPDDKLPDRWRPLVADGVLRPPPLDLDGYRECLQACRERHPGLRILSGVELGEPHWHASHAERLLGLGGFERVLASVHSTPAAAGPGFTEISARYRDQSPDQVVRLYLAETVRLIEEFDAFEILAHIDYPVRYWPADAKRYDPVDFEEEYRDVLRRLAAADKVLEANTRVPLHRQVLAWWREEGGQAVTFASDAHEPGALAQGFREAVRTARAAGFRPRDDPYAFWGRD